MTACDVCAGEGSIVEYARMSVYSTRWECPECHGTGEAPETPADEHEAING